MQILRSTKLDTYAQVSGDCKTLQQKWKKWTLRESVQLKIHQQPNSEKTYRRRNGGPKRDIKRI